MYKIKQNLHKLLAMVLSICMIAGLMAMTPAQKVKAAGDTLVLKLSTVGDTALNEDKTKVYYCGDPNLEYQMNLASYKELSATIDSANKTQLNIDVSSVSDQTIYMIVLTEDVNGRQYAWGFTPTYGQDSKWNFTGGSQIILSVTSEVTGTSSYLCDVALCDLTTEAEGSGSVTVNNQSLTQDASVKVVNDTEVTVNLTPDSNNYVSGWKVMAGDSELSSGVPETKDENFKEFKFVTQADAIVYPSFSVKGEDEKKKTESAFTSREPGNLQWAEKATELSYADALTFNYSAQVQDIILNSNFGKSWTYGEDPLEDPARYTRAVFNVDGDQKSEITVGTDEDYPLAFNADEVGGQYPKSKTDLASGITSDKVRPGRFTQTVTADYYTAKSICRNHWYHVGGVEYHKDGMNREITILKDTLSITTTQINFDNNGNIPADAITLEPASLKTPGTQATLKKDLITSIKYYDANGNEVGTPKTAGTYTVKVTYAGDDFVQAYPEGSELIATIVVKASPVQQFMADTFGATGENGFQATVSDVKAYAKDHADTIKAAADAYKALSEEDKAKVDALIQGSTYPELLAEVQAQDVESGDAYDAIADMSEITVDSKAAVDAAQEAYNALSDAAKTSPTGKAIEAKLAAMKKAADWADTYKAALSSDEVPMSKETMETLAQAMSEYEDDAKFDVEARKYIPEALLKKAGIAKEADAWLTDHAAIIEKTSVTGDDVEAIQQALDAYENLSEDAKAALGEDYLKDLNNKLKAAKWQKDSDEVLSADTPKLEDIRTAMDAYNHLTEDEKALVNPDFLAEMIQAQKDAFVKNYVSDKDGNVYKEADGSNYAQILSGKADWDAMSEAEQEAINEALIAAGSKSYPELLKAAEAIQKSTDGFVKNYVSDKKGNIYKAADGSNYAQILSGKADWDKMSKEEQEAVNAALIAAGGKSYPELLKAAEAIQKGADGFVKKYLTGKDGSIYKTATKDNYEQILSGKAGWKKLSQAEKDVINAKLKANGGKTYEELLRRAEAIKNLMNVAEAVKTGDNGIMNLYMMLVMLSFAGAAFAAKRKKENL